MVILLGSGRPESPLLQSLVDRLFAGIEPGERAPRIAVSLAAMAGNAGTMKQLAGWFSGRAFRGATVERFTLAGEADPMPADEARRIIERADLIYLSGGDPVVGAEVLTRSGADQWLRAARERGASLAGGSAGAILLGAWWARWPDEPDGRPFDGGTLVRCSGVVEDLVVDTHDEEDGWAELHLVQEMLRAGGVSARLRGIPTDGALVVHSDGRLEPVGQAPYLLQGT